MKRSLLIISFLGIYLASCTAKQTTFPSVTPAVPATKSLSDTLVTKLYNFNKEGKFAVVYITADLPTGSDAASTIIRDSLLADIDSHFAYNMEGDRTIPKGNTSDIKAYCAHYIDYAFKEYTKASKEQNADLGNKGDDIQQFATSIDITKNEAASYIIYTIESYTDEGGAHGNGAVETRTFDKKTGKEIKFLINGAENSLQKLLIQGLVRYYNSFDEPANESNIWDYLLLMDEKKVPLPNSQPSPSEQGLVFTYSPYEIAAYAAGSPTFTISYKDIAPYLTPEAKKILNLQ